MRHVTDDLCVRNIFVPLGHVRATHRFFDHHRFLGFSFS